MFQIVDFWRSDDDSLETDFGINSTWEMSSYLEAYRKVEETGMTYLEALEEYVSK